MYINAFSDSIGVSLALQNFLKRFFKEGELVRFTFETTPDFVENEAILKGNFLAEFPKKGLLEFGCKLFMMRDNSLWRMTQFMEISHPNFRDGMAVDLTLPTALERGHEFKKAMGF